MKLNKACCLRWTKTDCSASKLSLHACLFPIMGCIKNDCAESHHLSSCLGSDVPGKSLLLPSCPPASIAPEHGEPHSSVFVAVGQNHGRAGVLRLTFVVSSSFCNNFVLCPVCRYFWIAEVRTSRIRLVLCISEASH